MFETLGFKCSNSICLMFSMSDFLSLETLKFMFDLELPMPPILSTLEYMSLKICWSFLWISFMAPDTLDSDLYWLMFLIPGELLSLISLLDELEFLMTALMHIYWLDAICKFESLCLFFRRMWEAELIWLALSNAHYDFVPVSLALLEPMLEHT